MSEYRLKMGILLSIGIFIILGCSTNTKDSDKAAELRSQWDPSSLSAAGLRFSLPEGWVKERHESRIRVAQIRLPAANSGLQDGELIIFYFGESAGGDPEEALQRWISRFHQKDGAMDKTADEIAERTELIVGNFKIGIVELSGDYQVSGMMTGEPGSLKPDWGLLGAVIEGERGPWFIIGNGPEVVMQNHRESFFEFLKSVKVR